MVQTKGGHEMPRGKKFTAEQIIGKLREAEVGLAQGKTVPEPVTEHDSDAQLVVSMRGMTRASRRRITYWFILRHRPSPTR